VESYGGLLTYTGGWLDRVGGRRADAGWLDELLKSPDTTLIPFWRDQCLVSGDPPVPVTLRAARADGVVFLGLAADGHGVFATDLSGMEAEQAVELAGADRAVDVRVIVGTLSPAVAATAGYARGLLHWHRNQRFCGACGAATESAWGGHRRVCCNEACGRLHFPKIEPAVIMSVQTEREPERILLAHHRGSSAGRYSALAGFVEVGESLEDAVRREVAEETGVRVGAVRYVASQAWPFPSGLMIGFRATAITEDITVDGEELLEARWFTRPELARYAADDPLGRPDSIDRHLFRAWLAGADDLEPDATGSNLRNGASGPGGPWGDLR
jgi:NAD+ diphosphatase